MLESPLAPYLLWAKTRRPAAIDLAGSNLLHCTLEDLPGVAGAVDVSAPNDNGYAPLVTAIAAHYGVTTDRVVTGAGCSGANFVVVASLVGAGDEVLIERPTYDPLIGACRLMGATIERFERRFASGYRIDFEALAARLSSRTRLVIITNPHNPSGTLLEPSELDAVGKLANRVGAIVLVDEVYLDGANLIRAEDERSPSAARLDGPFVVTSSLTKSYGLAGLRCGWAIGSAAVAERCRRTRDVIDNAGSAPADRLSALAFTRLPALTERTRHILGTNVAAAGRFLADHPQLEVSGPPASSVVFPRLAGIDDAAPFVRRLVDEYGVAVAPGHFFDQPAHFRISLAGKPELLAAGLGKIAEALAKTK